jgi:hypothetical protein
MEHNEIDLCNITWLLGKGKDTVQGGDILVESAKLCGHTLVFVQSDRIFHHKPSGLPGFKDISTLLYMKDEKPSFR